MKTVRATALGYHNGSRVRPGTVFQVANEARASWWEEVTPPAPPAPEPRKTLKLEPKATEQKSDLL